MSSAVAALPAASSSHLAWSGGSPASGEACPDLLTGLATRGRLMEVLQAMLAAGAARPGLVLLDLDRFKAVNDSLGPLVGDALLCRIAQRLVAITPQDAVVARISGDGFAVLVEDGAEVATLAARILDVISRPYAVRGHAVTIGASLGTATAADRGATAHALLHAADLALHQAERDGRNRVRGFETSMQDRARLRQALEADLRAAMALQHVELRHALVSQQFELHYQPQVTLEDGRLTGLEALVRWRHPRRGLVSPAEFIPLAEEIGLIGLLGDWVLRTACRTAAAWPGRAGGTAPRIAVNLSPLQLSDGRAMIHSLRRALDESGLPPERLELELTESALAGDIGDTLSAIRRLGVALALDDFGTGHSSLGRLRRHSFARLKIDRSFIADVRPDADEATRGQAAWMIRAIASLGIGLGMGTVIEGIETPAQRDMAREAGCLEMQGFLIGRPMPAEAVASLLDPFPPPAAQGPAA